MNDDTNFPTVSEGTIGGALVQTVDGRELHASLKVGRDFSTWMKVRIDEYGFADGIDYVKIDAAPPVGGAGNRGARTEYFIALDMAKELAMVERNEEGKRVRRFFIECEKRLRAGLLPTDVMEMVRRTDGICRMTIGKVTAMEKQLPILAAQIASELLPAMLKTALASQAFVMRQGKTAGQIWHDHGFPPIKVTCWFGNRLARMGCAIEGGGCGELGMRKARVFDPDKADAWLKNGGRALVEAKIAERRGGQKVLRLVPKQAEAGNGEGGSL